MKTYCKLESLCRERFAHQKSFSLYIFLPFFKLLNIKESEKREKISIENLPNYLEMRNNIGNVETFFPFVNFLLCSMKLIKIRFDGKWVSNVIDRKSVKRMQVVYKTLPHLVCILLISVCKFECIGELFILIEHGFLRRVF
jgi:hypothetical protein